MDLGLGLASTRNIPKGSTVGYFVGELLSIHSAVYKKRVLDGKNKYMLAMGKEFIIDCMPMLETCKASRCNSFKNTAMFNDESQTWIKAVQNCVLAPDYKNEIVRIKSIKNIDRFTEPFVEYGKFFSFNEDL